MEKFPFTNEWILFNTNYFLMKFYTLTKDRIVSTQFRASPFERALILNLERTLFIRHQNGCLTKNCY